MTLTNQGLPLVFVFVDTEFTSLERPELISIGLSASDGTEFYCERTEYPLERCSAFVHSEVVPKLGWSWHAQADLNELAARTDAWLAAKSVEQLVVLAYDYLDDMRLAMSLLAPAVQEMVVTMDARWDTSDELLEEYFTKSGVLRHHALHDARGLACACAPWVSQTTLALELVDERLAPLPLARKLAFLRTAWPELGGAHPIQAINEGQLAAVQEIAAVFT